MYISKLSIRNFRNFNNAKFIFTNGVNTLIGENGSGKTNLFYAIRLLIDDGLSIRARFLNESDFNRQLTDWRGHWIIINARFDELDSDEESNVLVCHSIGNIEDKSEGSYSLIFRPKMAIRKKLYELSMDETKDAEKLQEIITSITISDYEPIITCKGNADFFNDEVYKKLVGDFENMDFPDPEEFMEDEVGCLSPSMFSFSKAVSCTFIKALRDVVSDLRNVKSNPLIKLLKGSQQNIDIEKANDLVTKVEQLNADISSLEEIKSITQGVKSTIEDAVGRTYAPNITIKSELPNDIDKLLQALTLWVGDPNDEDYQGRIDELSLGGANLVFLSLKLLEYEMKQSTDKIAHFLLIEEPEAHIHTHIQKTLFNKIKNKNTQVIISTHSTHISSVSKISSVNILCQERGLTNVYQPSVGLCEVEIKRIERYLDAIRSTLLFAKGTILVEGDAELILIPEMTKNVLGVSLDELGISLVNMSSTVFEHIALLFDEKRIKRNCSIITDLDLSILILAEDKNKDNTEERKCRNSQESGAARRDKLVSLFNSNEFVKVFYAKHTFEVDFLLSNNRYEVEESLKSVYKSRVDLRKESLKLLNTNDVSIAGKEVLRLANSVGKGWFALVLAEELTYKTYIPLYILQALAFAAKNHLSEKMLASMARYRIKQDMKNASEDRWFNGISQELLDIVDDEQNIKKLLELYEKELDNDQFTTFLKYYRGDI